MNDDKRETRDHFIDKAGSWVEVGDYIVYGHSIGRCSGLRFGLVLKIEQVSNWKTRNTWAWRILVQGVDDDWADHSVGEYNVPKLTNTKGTLQFPSRILKANDFVPGYVVDLCKPKEQPECPQA